MKIVKTAGYCPLCGPSVKTTFQNKQKIDVTQFTCETHKVSLQREKPTSDPSRVKFLLPFLKVKERVKETVSGIRQASLEKQVALTSKLLEGKKMRAGMQSTYARVLALVQQQKHLTTKALGLLLGIPPAKAAGWLERLRALHLVTREKQQGPVRMVWHYFLLDDLSESAGTPVVSVPATTINEICERLKRVEALLVEGGNRSIPVVPPPAPRPTHLCPPPKVGEKEEASKAVVRELDALFASGGMKWAKFSAAEIGQKDVT